MQLCCGNKWLKLTSDDVKDQIYKLAKKGLTPSQIGKQTFPRTSYRNNYVLNSNREWCRWKLSLLWNFTDVCL